MCLIVCPVFILDGFLGKRDEKTLALVVKSSQWTVFCLPLDLLSSRSFSCLNSSDEGGLSRLDCF